MSELRTRLEPDGASYRLSKVADWYESGPAYPVEFEEGRQRIARDLREVLAIARMVNESHGLEKGGRRD